MRHRLPKGCRGVSHAGRQLAVAADGTLDLDAAAAGALAPHGVTAAPEPAPAKPGADRNGTKPR